MWNFHYVHQWIRTAVLFCCFAPSIPIWGEGGRSFFYTGNTQYQKRYSSVWTGYSNPKRTLPIPPTDDSAAAFSNSGSANSPNTQTASFFQAGGLDAADPNPDSETSEFTPLKEYGSLNDDMPNSFFLDDRPERDSLFQGFAASIGYIPNTGEKNSGMTSLAGSASLTAPLPDKNHPLLLIPDIQWNDFFFPQETISYTGEKAGLYSMGGSIQYLFPMNERVLLHPWVDIHWCSDLVSSNSDALRITGGAAALVKTGFNNRLLIGAYYTGLSSWTVVPIAGMMFRPSDDWILDICFPKPKIARRITCIPDCRGENPYWAYISGELYCDRWSIKSKNTETANAYNVSYYDYRFFTGMERRVGDELNWAIEGGIVLGRELELRAIDAAPSRDYYPDTTGMVRLKITY